LSHEQQPDNEAGLPSHPYPHVSCPCANRVAASQPKRRATQLQSPTFAVGGVENTGRESSRDCEHAICLQRLVPIVDRTDARHSLGSRTEDASRVEEIIDLEHFYALG